MCILALEVNTKMRELTEIWSDFVKLDSLELNSGIQEILKRGSTWDNLHEDLKCILTISNGQKKSETGIFGMLKNGKFVRGYNYLGIELITKVNELVSK